MTHQAIDVECLGKQLRRRHALSNATFDVPVGSICGVVGPNGAGKTTLIRILCGAIKPSAGTAHICGFDVVRQRRDASRAIGVAFDPPHLYPYLSAIDNLSVFARSWDPAVSLQDPLRALARLDLLNSQSQPVGRLSTGTVRRLGIAAALMGTPKVLVLDEPMNGLDPVAVGHVARVLRELASMGTTILMSSHLLSEAEGLCDRVIFMKNGQIALSGELRTLLKENGHRITLDEPERAVTLLAARSHLHVTLVEDGILISADALTECLSALSSEHLRIIRVEPMRTGLADLFRDSMH